MTQVLKQSTAVDVLIGPFVDKTDAATAETGESASVKLSKNGQALAAKNDVTTPVHDADGYYNCELDATDTNTVGTLVLTVAASANALPVRHEYQVIEEAVYDAMYGANAAGPLQSTTAGRTLDVTATGAAGIDWANVENPTTAVDLSGTDIQLCNTVTTNSDMRGTDSAALASVCTEARLSELDAATAGKAANQIDEIRTDTGEIGAAGAGLTAIPWNASWDTEVESEVNDALDTAIAELAQAAPTATPTIRTALMLLYMLARNKLDITNSVKEVYNDAGTVIAKKTLSDDGTTYSEAEMASGP